MKPLSIFLLLLISVALIVGCGNKSKNVKEEAKVPVTVTDVKLGKVLQSIIYNGDVQAEFAVKVFSKIPDRIETFYVDEGDYVEKGKPIAKIFATAIGQGVRQANAGVAALRAQESNLRVEYERTQRLFKEGAVSQQQYDALDTQYKAIKAQVEQAEAGLASASSALQDATITAPISGIVGKRYLEAGDMASPGIPLAEIVQMERVKVTFDVTENDLGRVKVGQSASVRIKGYADKLFEGQVFKISPILDPLTRMATVEVMVENKERQLKPGMFAEITVITGVIDNVITVPLYAAIENTSMMRINGNDEVVKKYLVFVVQGDKAVQRELDVKYVNHVSLAVNGGLTVGEKLVVQGQNNLRDNVGVVIIEEEK
jgi:membrane fusion protein, multidrug efflux system